MLGTTPWELAFFSYMRELATKYNDIRYTDVYRMNVGSIMIHHFVSIQVLDVLESYISPSDEVQAPLRSFGDGQSVRSEVSSLGKAATTEYWVRARYLHPSHLSHLDPLGIFPFGTGLDSFHALYLIGVLTDLDHPFRSFHFHSWCTLWFLKGKWFVQMQHDGIDLGFCMLMASHGIPLRQGSWAHLVACEAVDGTDPSDPSLGQMF